MGHDKNSDEDRNGSISTTQPRRNSAVSISSGSTSDNSIEESRLRDVFIISNRERHGILSNNKLNSPSNELQTSDARGSTLNEAARLPSSSLTLLRSDVNEDDGSIDSDNLDSVHEEQSSDDELSAQSNTLPLRVEPKFYTDVPDPATASSLTAVEILDSLSNYEKTKFDDLIEGVEEVLRELNSHQVLVRLLNGTEKKVHLNTLNNLPRGETALENWQSKQDAIANSSAGMPGLRSRQKKRPRPSYIDTLSHLHEDDEFTLGSRRSTRQRSQRRSTSLDELGQSAGETDTEDDIDVSEEDDHTNPSYRRRQTRARNSTRQSSRRSTRNSSKPSSRHHFNVSQSDDDELNESDERPAAKRKRSSKTPWTSVNKPMKPPVIGTRRSERATRHTHLMEEVGEDEIFARDTDPAGPPAVKVQGAKETFKTLSRSDAFRNMHQEWCETCKEGSSINSLIYCQGCSLAYHRDCIGHRGSREHLVTKVGEGNFVLQCRRCVNVVRSKEQRSPNLALCQVCHVDGESCSPFRVRKTAAQEQKEREENNGEDPITRVKSTLVNTAANVLFRCTFCWRAFHFHHLPPKKRTLFETDVGNLLANRRFQEYSTDWRCIDCSSLPSKVSSIIAWRPVNIDKYVPGTLFTNIEEDAKEYLIKWENMSYFKVEWRPGAWTWGVTASAMRKAFMKRESGPKARTEDAIPEEFLRIDIILAVNYKRGTSTDQSKRQIQDVEEALIKYKGLSYEESTWDIVPIPSDGERWMDFETAYHDWVLGLYIHPPKAVDLKARLEKIREQEFISLEMKKQPDIIVGGELMDFQLEGLNWIYYQWHKKQNAILADEMGLGKTIQVISFLATLVQQHGCFPFLVVVPNATCANWRREIKQWAPGLRVVTYFGSSKARELAHQYEMFPEGSKDLRCHVVVTSFEAASDMDCRRVFKSVHWAGLVVDEGQRLKSDKSILYNALLSFKIPFRLLLTGTPLQNNARELFNLLQFLDDSLSAEELEQQYAEMNPETVKKLHDLIRPFILRRTKAEVLTFLPPMAQIIVPLSMSVLQKKLYKSILSKSPELIKAIFAKKHQSRLKPQERAGLSNILMQLRKCLCHPFVYSQDIEERTDIAGVSHRNLVEASAKLQLLEILLLKLRARGHRVLIFSQFLDMLTIIEDFLDGLQLPYQRLDGSMGSLEKQKRIDEFNAPGSPLFAFLLSTRAGGVGINLATADTVIILDPDFNPHQDIQAISRAHRIGQKNKVLCFQFMTRSSAEEKIFQIGRRKMALDHVVVQNLDKEDDMEDGEVEAMLRHGAAELFSDQGGADDIKYDSASVNRLLDRSNIENTKAPDGSAESQFSFARVWANDAAVLQEDIPNGGDDPSNDASVWDQILQERERAAQSERQARDSGLGRGKRARGLVHYAANDVGGTADDGEPDGSPIKLRKAKNNDESDTDFMANSSSEEEADVMDYAAANESEAIRSPVDKDFLQAAKNHKAAIKPFQRAEEMKVDPPPAAQYGLLAPACPACTFVHAQGHCPLKMAGVEHCNLCGLAHYGVARTCPHFSSETQVRAMLEALKMSPERKDLVDAAVKYLRGVKGHIVQKKKKDRGEFVGGGPPRSRNRVIAAADATRQHQGAGQASFPPAQPAQSGSTQVGGLQGFTGLQGFQGQRQMKSTGSVEDRLYAALSNNSRP